MTQGNWTRRRTALTLALCAPMVLMKAFGRETFAKANYLPQHVGMDPDFLGPVPEDDGSLGTQPALPMEEEMALHVLNGAPQQGSPLAIAQYFYDVGSGKFGAQYEPFVYGWPTRWNPVIRRFFQATKTQPSGDVTPWCAAFLNWCYLRSGRGVATDNASSGSFRCFGESIAKPAPGDIVVFREPGSTEQCLGHGHVGFFVADAGSAVDVLGGNQIPHRGQSHRISIQRLAKHGRRLELHSFRRAVPP